MKKIGIVLGTRPEIIKLSSIIRHSVEGNLDYSLIHTNQHYTPELDRIFFEELELPPPHYNLNVGSGKQGEQTARMIIELERVYEAVQPDIVIVQGDTNTVLAGALAATKMGIMVAHVEAGLRSFDRNMPEETNRILTDHMSDFLFAPTHLAVDQLLTENIDKNKIFNVGNTVVDAVYHNIKISERDSNIMTQLSLEKESYILMTVHRAENTNNPERLRNIFKGVQLVEQKFNKKIIYPIHPRTKNVIEKEGIDIPKGVQILEPLGYLDFLKLIHNAKVILTDSGGIQEEACILRVPCITLRANTERPLTLKVNSNILAGDSPDSILSSVSKMWDITREWDNPYGSGKSGEIILDILNQS